MTPAEQNVAIAETCGWKRHKNNSKFFSKAGERVVLHDTELPDYCSDLNAMHDAEKVILRDESLHSGDESVSSHYLRMISPVATAAQRAEAFLKTLNKWSEQ